MKGLRVGTRYSKALVAQAKEQSALEEVQKDVLLMQKAMNESNDLHLLLESPIVKTEKKIQILKKIFESKISDLSLNFLMMVTEQKRESFLSSMLDSFMKIYNEEHGIAIVQVTTASSLSDENRKNLIANIKEKYQLKNIELKERVAEELIGGMVIRIGDKMIDRSVRRQLKEVHQELLNA